MVMSIKVFIILFVELYLVVLSFAGQAHHKEVLCIGDSITYGTGSSNVSASSYPARLSTMLQNHQQKYVVYNYGFRGATLQKNTEDKFTYWKTDTYQNAMKHSNASITIIMLGANDAKFMYGFNEAEFVSDYVSLVDSFRSLNPHIRVYICIPTVILPRYASIKVNSTIINGIYPSLLPIIAKRTNTILIDTFAALGGTGLTVHGECVKYFVNDGLHPNDVGYMQIAKAIYEKVFVQ